MSSWTARKEQQQAAADSLCSELLKLLRHATVRGLSAVDSFQHFDKSRSGFVEVDAFIDGLARLGLSTSQPVADALMERISLGTVFFTASDLDRFIRNSSSIDDAHDLAGTAPQPPRRETKRRAKEAARTSSMRRQLRALSSSTAPIRDKSISPAREKDTVIASAPLLPLPEDSYAHGLNHEAKRRFSLHLRRHRVAYRELSRARNSRVGAAAVVAPGDASDRGAGESLVAASPYDASPCLDELLHVGEGAVMTYRLLGSVIRPPSKEEGDSPSYTVVVVPDAMATLDTLQARLADDLTAGCGGATVVLVGLLGLPHTVWPAGRLLDADTQAKCVGELLSHLHAAGRLLRNPLDPLVVLGVGTGGFIAAHFCASYLPRMPSILQSVRALCLVNGFVRMHRNTRRSLEDLRAALEVMGEAEVPQLLLQLLFSQQYVDEVGRGEAMRVFWRDRSGGTSTSGFGAGLEGVLSMLRGLLVSSAGSDEATLLSAALCPIILVQSSDDVFVSARATEGLWNREKLPPPRFPVDALSEARRGAVWTSWLAAGHEVMQERRQYVVSLVNTVGCLFAHRQSAKEVKLSESVLIEEASAEEDGDDDEEEEEEEESHMSSVGLIEEYDVDGDEDQSEVSSTLHVYEADEAGDEGTAVDSEAAAIEVCDEADAGGDRVRRKAERVDRLRRIERAADMDFARSWMRVESAGQRERDEAIAMEREDVRARLAGQWEEHLAFLDKSNDNARAISIELMALRRAEAVRAVEQEIAMKRAERVELRRQRAAALLHEIESESILLAGEQTGGYDVPDASNVIALIESTRRLFGDYLECRQKAVQSLKRHEIMSDKMEVFREHSRIMLADVRKLRRAVRLAQTNPGLVADGRNIGAELQKLESNLFQKEQSYWEFTVISKQREAQFAASSKNFQRFKIKLKELENKMTSRLSSMHDLNAKLTRELKLIRSDNDKLVTQKVGLVYKKNALSFRRESLAKEQERILNHTGHFIDTDLWIEGVLQRCVTKDLRRHLRREYELTDEGLKKVEGELSSLRGSIMQLLENLQKFERDVERVSLAAAVFGRYFNQLKCLAIKATVDRLSKFYNAAETKENDEILNRDAQMRAIGTGCIDRIRQKDLDNRSPDEKMIIAIDALLYPEHYIDITTREAEEMQLDEMYITDLAKSDAERIMRLPEKVALALPFLHTRAEIDAHRLMNKFYREKDTDYFLNLDFNSENAGFVSEPSKLRDGESLFTLGAFEKADGIHDLLLKESRRDRLRTCADIEGLTEEEQNWISIDKILSPEIYCDDEDVEDIQTAKESSVKFFLTSNVLTGKIRGVKAAKITHTATITELLEQNNEGDKYDKMRSLYDSGISVFEKSSWICPFTREEIIQIQSMVIKEDTSDEEKRVHQLLSKFYVDENESVIGHERLTMMKTVMKEINKLSHLSLESRQTKALVDIEGNEMYMLTEIEGNQRSTFRRVWGSWDQVHPASASRGSQLEIFYKSSYSAARDHPASFAARNIPESSLEKLIKLPLPAGADINAIGLSTLAASNSDKNEFNFTDNDPNSVWYIVNSLDELATKDKQAVGGKVVLVTRPDAVSIFKVDDASLQSRQSRSHYFSIADSDSLRILELTITVVFQGSFGDRGYKLGRLAATLFRLPDSKDNSTNPLPRPIGYTPYELIVPNSPNTLGRIVILHKPRVKPLKPGSYQIVIGAASYTKYSIEVHCKGVRAVLPFIDEEIIKAKEMQARLPVCLKELEGLVMSLRLAERKLHLCSKMIVAADAESKRIQRRMRTVTTALEVDDEEMVLREDERRELQREITILEIEFTEWVAIFGSRCKEKVSIKDGIDLMQASNIRKQAEKARLKDQLHRYRNILPLCIDLLRNVNEAANLAVALNSQHRFQTFEGPAGSDPSLLMQTPAARVRSLFRLKGWRALNVEEQQWTILDQELRPHLYDWQREQDEEENNKRMAMGKLPKKKKISSVVESIRFSKIEIEHLLSRPYVMLTRKEGLARKLLIKYHDEKELLKQKQVEIAFGFDSHLAERVRSKSYVTYTKEEKEWASIDRILHPDVWRYYCHGHVDAEAFKPMRIDTKTDVSNDLNDISKILGVNEQLGNLASEYTVDGKLDMRAAIESTQKSLVQLSDGSALWVCELSKDEIIHIWKAHKDTLETPEQRLIFRLLHKYNGAFSLNNVEDNKNKDGTSHRIQFGNNRSLISADPDKRCHYLLREIDRATQSKLKLLDSDQLHSLNQRFPPDVLRLQLEAALDKELTEQILERERDEHYKGLSDSECSESSEEALSDASDDGGRLSVRSSGEGGAWLKAATEKRDRRISRKQKRKRDLKKADFATEVVRTTNFLMNRKAVTSLQLEDAKLHREIGSVGICLACRTKGCQWEETVDVDAIQYRMESLQVEIERVKFDKESRVMNSLVALSALQGGNTKFRRKDLLAEITSEYGDLERRLQLSFIDKELHDAFATREAFVEVKHLHGYATMLSTVNARIALAAARSRLIAMTTAREIVDDILDWMLEGWQFGERQSTFRVMGYVPSIKKDGIILAGQDQIKAVEASNHKIKYRMEMKKNGILLPLFINGNAKDKSIPIEEDADRRKLETKVAKVGSDHEKLLNETESTLRFGLFMITLMYFRAMAYLSREKKSWSGQGDDSNSSAKVLTQERMRMLEETSKVGARKKRLEAIMLRCKIGEKRRKEREDAERKESLMKLQAVVRRQKLEAACVGLIQKVYRGHLSRKAVRRWALKKAELAAMFAVLNSTAIYIQRIWRGYVGRVITKQKRLEMAHFIALMRQQEAEDDEFVYWETHPWSKFKRDVRTRIGRKELEEDQTDLLAHHLNEIIE